MCSKLVRDGLQALGYVAIKGAGAADAVGGLYVPGFMGSMSGAKPLAVERLFKSKRLSFTRFDYSGLGESASTSESLLPSFYRWQQDLMDVLDNVTQGPMILVGSSMGAWMSILATLARPDRIKALVLIAPGIDFVRGFYERELTQEVPVRIVHGLADKLIPSKASLKLLHTFASDDVDIVYRKSSEHRFQSPEDLKVLCNAVSDVIDCVVGNDNSRL